MKLDSPDVSPRLEAMFSTVRKRLLPTLIRERFKAARTALEQKKLAEAEPQLAEAKLMIADAEKLAIQDEGLADLSVLVDGFLQLVRSTADQRQATAQPAAANVAQESPAATASAPAALAPTAPAPTAPAATAPAATGPASRRTEPAPVPASPPRVYTVDDVGVVPPAVINQRMPAMTPDLVRITKAMNTSAVVEIVIDEKGDVVDATVIKSVNTSFDNLVIGAARRWKYRPALKDGVAVRYVKTIILVP